MEQRKLLTGFELVALIKISLNIIYNLCSADCLITLLNLCLCPTCYTVIFLSRHQLLIIIGVINHLVVTANFRIIWSYVYQTLGQELRILQGKGSVLTITYLQASVKNADDATIGLVITITKHTSISEVWCQFQIIAIV